MNTSNCSVCVLMWITKIYVWNLTSNILPYTIRPIYFPIQYVEDTKMSLVGSVGSRIMWCAFFSRQPRYSNATHALTNARQSFWIIRVHQLPAFSIIFDILPCVTRSLTVIAKTTCDRPFKHQQNYYPMKWFLWHSRQYLGFVQNIWHYNQIRFSEWFVFGLTPASDKVYISK